MRVTTTVSVVSVCLLCRFTTAFTSIGLLRYRQGGVSRRISSRTPLMMAKKKGSVKGGAKDGQSKKKAMKQEMRETREALAARAPNPGGAVPGYSSAVPQTRDADEENPNGSSDSVEPRTLNVNSGTIEVEFEEEPDSPEPDSRAEAMQEGENLLKYAKKNGLAVDLETMAIVKLPKGSEEKMKAVFPYSTAELREKYPFPIKPTLEEFIAAFDTLVPGESTDVKDLKGWLLANRHVGGVRAQAILVQLKQRHQSLGEIDLAKRFRHLTMAVIKAESAINGPFRQAIRNAESRMAPNMGSMEPTSYSGSDSADINAVYLCLKAVIAEWEKRYREMTGDTISIADFMKVSDLSENKLDLERTTRILGAVQGMGQKFTESERLMSKLRPEIKFLEVGLSAGTTTEVRRLALKEFCPANNISPEELRYRLRGLVANLEALPRASYAQLQIAISEIFECLAEGTADEYNLYQENMVDGGKLRYETYDLSGEEDWRQNWKTMISAPKEDLSALVGLKSAGGGDENWETVMDPKVLASIAFAGLGLVTNEKKDWLNAMDENKERLKQPEIDMEGDIYDDYEKQYASLQEVDADFEGFTVPTRKWEPEDDNA